MIGAVLLALAGALVLAAPFLAYRSPRLALMAWLVMIGLVPVWFGTTIIIPWRPASAFAVLAVLGLAFSPPRRFNTADLGVVFFFGACVAPLLVGGMSWASALGLGTEWVSAYLLGRLLAPRLTLAFIYRAIGVTFAVIAALAIIEFVVNFHPYVSLGPSNALHDQWGPIQIRSGFGRSEGAFGHSIALGASLALAAPLVLAIPGRRWVRLGLLAVIIGGVLVTFSRAAIISAALAILLTAVFGRGAAVRSIRVPALVLWTVAAGVSLPFLLASLSEAGVEAAGSAQYRQSLLSLLPEFDVLGLSASASRAPGGSLFFGQFQSIDSQLILVGLTYGLIPFIVGCALLAISAVRVVARQALPLEVAVVGQIPVLATVALITQYASFFWFAVGLAVAAAAEGHRRGSTVTSDSGGSVFEPWPKRPTVPDDSTHSPGALSGSPQPQVGQR